LSEINVISALRSSQHCTRNSAVLGYQKNIKANACFIFFVFLHHDNIYNIMISFLLETDKAGKRKRLESKSEDVEEDRYLNELHTVTFEIWEGQGLHSGWWWGWCCLSVLVVMVTVLEGVVILIDAMS
jgi:hypothetical protein